MTEFENEATIGTIKHEGVTYEIDWPFILDNPEERDDYATIYRDGNQVGEACPPFGVTWKEEDEVLEAARAVIETGDIDDGN